MTTENRTTLLIFIKYIAISFLLLFLANFLSHEFLESRHLDTLTVFVFALTMAFAINESYKKGTRQQTSQASDCQSHPEY